MKEIRQPIVTVAGHVDHGKTSILDAIRGTTVQEGEAGGITQKISFTTIPQEVIKKRAGNILEKYNVDVEIPGILCIDTPGHAAFTNLRKRGGSLADIAVLVIDVNDGIKPQTNEVLQILKAHKTPFIIALNKLDNISGWKTSESGVAIESLQQQATNVTEAFEEKLYTLIGALHSLGITADLYSKVSDFTKSVAIVPCSAKTGEGIEEILSMIVALSQKYLQDAITVGAVGKGVVLEVKKEKTGNYIDCILYDGALTTEDEIAIASFEEIVVSRIRSMSVAKPFNKGFEVTQKTSAASGIRLQLVSKEEILPGMPFRVVQGDVEEIKNEFSEELSEEIQTDQTGILVKADSLGSLEALLVLLRQEQIPVLKAGIGPITKKDIYTAHALPEEDRSILGFNVDIAEDTDVEEKERVQIFTNPVVYRLIEEYREWKKEQQKEIERAKLAELPTIAKIEILDYIFRNSNPAVFGVAVRGGILKKGERFITRDNEKIGQAKEIQEEKNTVKEAQTGKEVALSMPGVTFDRQLEVGQVLYTDLSETQFRTFKKHKDLLNKEEKTVLQEIAQIKRRENDTWGI